MNPLFWNQTSRQSQSQPTLINLPIHHYPPPSLIPQTLFSPLSIRKNNPTIYTKHPAHSDIWTANKNPKIRSNPMNQPSSYNLSHYILSPLIWWYRSKITCPYENASLFPSRFEFPTLRIFRVSWLWYLGFGLAKSPEPEVFRMRSCLQMPHSYKWLPGILFSYTNV